MPGAIVLQRQESPLAMLLAGLGQGIAGGMERFVQGRLQKRNATEQILEAVTTGQIDPMVFTSDVGQEFLKSKKIDKDPRIQALMSAGQQRYEQFAPPQAQKETPGGMAFQLPKPSGPVPYTNMRAAQEEEAAQRGERQFAREQNQQLDSAAKAIQQERQYKLQFRQEDFAKGKQFLDSLRAQDKDAEIDYSVNQDGSVSMNYIPGYQVKQRNAQAAYSLASAKDFGERQSRADSAARRKFITTAKSAMSRHSAQANILQNIAKGNAGQAGAMAALLQIPLPPQMADESLPLKDRLEMMAAAFNQENETVNGYNRAEAELLGVDYKDVPTFNVSDLLPKETRPAPTPQKASAAINPPKNPPRREISDMEFTEVLGENAVTDQDGNKYETNKDKTKVKIDGKWYRRL